MSTPTTPRFQARWFSIGVVLVLILAACQAGSGDTTTTSEVRVETTTSTPATTTTVVAEVDALAVVMSSIEARNAGDFDAWLALRASIDGDDHDFSLSVFNSNERIELEDECRITAEEADRIEVECRANTEDDFHGAGGLVSSGDMKFTVNGDGLIVNSEEAFYQDENGDCCPDWQAYHTDFFIWLESAHPDVYAEIKPAQGTPSWYLPGVASGNPDHMLIALEYVDEFVAQSEKYPIGEAAATADPAPVVEPLGRAVFVSEVSGELSTLVDGAQSIVSEFGDASDIVFAKITIPAGGEAPWHSHTGPALLVNVGPGTLASAITEGCVVQEITPGAAFLDPGNGIPHAAVNTSDQDVVLYAVFLGVVDTPVIGAVHADGCDL